MSALLAQPLRLHRCIPWLWRAASSTSPALLACAATRSFRRGVSASVNIQGNRALLSCRGGEVGAGMEVDAEDSTVGALSNGALAVGEGAGGNEKQSPKLLTLVIVRQGERVLLGMKKRGFGAGYFNGFGGKVERNETVCEAAARELREECGVVPVAMEKRGVLTFHFDDNPQPWEVHVYHVGEYAGEPCETEEMAPRWFHLADIPYDRMWQDDPIWYPEFLHGRLFKGDFFFHNTHTLVSHTLRVLPTLDA